MPKLSIDNKQIEVPDGWTILDAAEKAGIEIPKMCFLKPYKATTSCMVCVVRLADSDALVPACGWVVQDGMIVDTKSEVVTQSRKAALELLLSDHLGDCIGPCQTACPAQMNIPLMIRQIAAGQYKQALKNVKQDIAMPAVLSRICSAPCEKACRRGQIDEAVSVCLLKRFVADVDLQSQQPWRPECKDLCGKTVAVIGAGPAGLSAAYYLRQSGYQCTVFDDHDKAGGMLRYGIDEDVLPPDILDSEIKTLMDCGIEFKGNVTIGKDIPFDRLRKEFDSVFIAIGKPPKNSGQLFGLPINEKGIVIERNTYETALEGVFAGGDIVRNRRQAVRSVADGKEAAIAISQVLKGQAVSGQRHRFNSRFGKLKDGEKDPVIFGASVGQRTEADSKTGLTAQQAQIESQRCLHCDCRKADNCKLRDIAERYGAKSTRYKDPDRKLFVQNTEHDLIVYEPGKCIACGLCLQIAAESGEEIGLSFINRGFDVRVDVPFGRPMNVSLLKSAEKCVNCCPTGALALKDM